MRPQPKYLVPNTAPRNNARNLIEFKHMHDTAFLGPIAKLEKATLFFVMSVCLCVCVCVCVCLSVYMSVCPYTWNDLVPTGQVFVKIDISFFSKIPQEYSSSITFLTRLTSILHVRQYLTKFFLEEKIFHKALQKRKTYILRSISFLRKSCRIRDNVEKFDRT
jgi:hypothetical protein